MSQFTLHSPESAPLGAKPILESIKKAWNFIPNLHATLAESPVALEGYTTLQTIFEKSSFSAVELQVIYLTANFENDCRYCMAGHSVLAKMAGMPEPVLNALRDGRTLPDTRLEALRRFTAQVIQTKGYVSEVQIASFIAAGFSKAQILEIVTGIAIKTIANYANHIAATPLDEFMKDTVWVHPAKRQAAE